MAVSYIVKTAASEVALPETGSHLRVERLKGATSTASWILDQDCDTAPLWTFGTQVSILRRVGGFDEILFQGKIISADPSGEPDQETFVYVAADAWWDFEREIYKSSRKVMDVDGNLVSAAYARVLLCQASDGSRINAAAMCSAICTFASSIGIVVQAGTFDAPVLPPWDEIADKTLAEIILRVLRWQPDAAPWIDHSTTPPTLNVTRRGSAEASSVAFSALEICRVRSYPELQVNGVVISFESSNAYGRTISEQTAGNPNALGCARMTIPLEFEAGVLGPKQEVKVVALGDYTQVAWWKTMFPYLPNTTILSDVMSTPVIPEGFVNVLISGQITQWMQDELNLDAGIFTISCKAEFTKDGHTYSSKELSRDFTLTNAVTKRYIGRSDPGWSETAPDGLAESFYAATSALQYGGQIVVVESECSIGRSLIGRVLNVTGGLTAWATMDADVISVIEDFDSGTTTIQMGPFGSLLPQDMIELIRCSRWRSKFEPLNPQDGGAPADDSTVVDPFTPEYDTSEAPGQLEGLDIIYEEP